MDIARELGGAFSWLDAVLVVWLALSFVSGFRRGLIRQALDVLGVVLGFVVAIRTFRAAAQLLDTWVVLPWNVSAIIAFVVIFCMTIAIVEAVGAILRRILGFGPISVANSLLGGGLGVLKTLIVITVLVAAASWLNLPWVDDVIMDSVIARQLKGAAPVIYEEIERLLPRPEHQRPADDGPKYEARGVVELEES